MATDGDLLLRAILDNPAEDTPRLIYADYLQENGQGERAEFIRAQVRGERPKLKKAQADAWFQVFPFEYGIRRGSYLWYYGEPHNTAVIRRGFVASITCTAADWIAHADAIVAAHPIERVRLTTWAGHPEVFEDGYLEDRWPRIAFELPGPNIVYLPPGVSEATARAVLDATAE